MGLVGVIARHDRHNLPLLLAILIIIEAESAAHRSTDGNRTFAADANLKELPEESRRSGHQLGFSIVQTRRKAARSMLRIFSSNPEVQSILVQ